MGSIWSDSSSFISSMRSFLYTTATFVVGLGVVVGGLLYVKQESILYLPEIGGIPRRPSDNPRRYRNPGESGIPYTSHRIECEDGIFVHAWFLDRSRASTGSEASGDNQKPTLVFFHGNAGNIGLRLPNAIQMYQYLDANILMVEYRGFGESQDVKPNEVGLKLDAEAALKFLVNRQGNDAPKVDRNKIFIFGRSLGGAVTFHLANYAQKNNIPLAGVIVENTFLSIPDMVDKIMPLVAPLKGLILRMYWESKNIVPNLKTPILYLAGSLDELVPHEHMLQLHKTSRSSRLVRMHIIRDGTHNETWMQGGQEYWKQMKQFMADALSLGPLASSADENCSIGQGSASTNQVEPLSQSIPTMSSNLFGMLGDAVGGTAKASATKKDI